MNDLVKDDNCGAQLLKHFSGTIGSTGQTSICSQQEVIKKKKNLF
jgi:hypothetical protein